MVAAAGLTDSVIFVNRFECSTEHQLNGIGLDGRQPIPSYFPAQN
jgi:hypothetical protein